MKKDLLDSKLLVLSSLTIFSYLILGLMSSGVYGRASCGPASGRKPTEKER